MRFVFILSGFTGFLLVALTGFLADRAPDAVLRDAALGCLIAALLGRWFWRNLQNAVAQTAALRRATAEAAAEAEAAKTRPETRPGAAGASLTPASLSRPSPATAGAAR
jgi:hypothetical protein